MTGMAVWLSLEQRNYHCNTFQKTLLPLAAVTCQERVTWNLELNTNLVTVLPLALLTSLNISSLQHYFKGKTQDWARRAKGGLTGHPDQPVQCEQPACEGRQGWFGLMKTVHNQPGKKWNLLRRLQVRGPVPTPTPENNPGLRCPAGGVPWPVLWCGLGLGVEEGVVWHLLFI